MDAMVKVGEAIELSLTYEDYAALPDDGRRYQLLEGEIDVTPTPSTRHQRISRNLEFLILLHINEHQLGALYHAPIDVILAEDTVVQPDILFVARERMSIVSERGIEAAPNLVVEILSRRTRRTDRTTKMRLYGRAGVQECWLVDADAQTVEVFALREGQYVLTAAQSGDETLHSDVVSGLTIPLRTIFADDL
jgi:Uma2 family endonuclease